MAGRIFRFTVNKSIVPSVVDYIKRQREHHSSKTFECEYRELLERHEIDFDERYLRSDLVDAVYKRLTPMTVNAPSDVAQFQTSTWPGYVGSPRIADARYGKQLQEYRATRDIALTLAIIDGQLDERAVPRYGAIMLAAEAAAKVPDRAALNEQAIAQKQREWMKNKGIE